MYRYRTVTVRIFIQNSDLKKKKMSQVGKLDSKLKTVRTYVRSYVRGRESELKMKLRIRIYQLKNVQSPCKKIGSKSLLELYRTVRYSSIDVPYPTRAGFSGHLNIGVISTIKLAGKEGWHLLTVAVLCGQISKITYHR